MFINKLNEDEKGIFQSVTAQPYNLWTLKETQFNDKLNTEIENSKFEEKKGNYKLKIDQYENYFTDCLEFLNNFKRDLGCDNIVNSF